MLTFKMVTVAVVFVILGLFAVGAYKAEKVLADKAKEIQESRISNKNKK